MSNLHRGEVSVELSGQRYVLRLTLQALAEIEAAFAVDGLEALGARFGAGRLGTRDLLSIFGALIRGSGERIADDDLASAIEAHDLPVIIAAIGDVFAASFTESGAAKMDARLPQGARRTA